MKTEIVENTSAIWDELFLESNYIIADEMLKLFNAGKFDDLRIVLQKNKETQQQIAETELKRFLKDLMENILLWKFSLIYRTDEQMARISKLRMDIKDSLDCEGCLSERNIKEYWKEAFDYAKNWAVARVKEAETIEDLTWYEVFTQDYIYNG